MDPKKFEKEVINQIKLMGFNVLPEYQLGSKKVDFLANKLDEFGKIKQYVGECKYYKSPITKKIVVEIIADYLPFLESNYNLLVITQEGLTASAATYVQNLPNVYHKTYLELLNSTMDFTLYIQSVKSFFFIDDLNNTYIEQGFREGDTSIENYIENWLNSENYSPLAILGGYGMGKTTLAVKLAYSQAIKHEENPFERIPIYIKLEDLSTESTLEGLLGKLFTSVNIIKNYSFPLFMKLNEEGRFLIILDGFDEMKRTMSEDALIFNFEQLNRLIIGYSRVILLGRPTVFLSEKEQKEVLHGVNLISNKAHEKINYPKYNELNLKPFNKNQIEEFITKKVELYRSKSSDKTKITRFDNYLNGLNDKDSSNLIEIASRPVQLKMLTEILPIHDGDLSKITVSILYSEFIDLIIRRESRKYARSSFNYQNRRAFASSLAYWMWINNFGAEIKIGDIEPQLFKPFIKNGLTVQEVERDLLLGCFLEKKEPSGLYFPHRTFQEFLVAEEIYNIITEGSSDLSNCSFLTPEIKSFFIEIVGKNEIIRWRKNVNRTPAFVNNNSRELLNTVCRFYNLKIAYDPSSRIIENIELERQRINQKIHIEKDIISKKKLSRVKGKVKNDQKHYVNKNHK